MATRVKDLAERIYIDMVSRIALAPGAPDGTKPKPEAIARLSFKLAEAFMAVDNTSEEDAAPVAKKYEIAESDMADWMK
ncbi:MAG: hypothetical protein ACKVQQ_06485 [Burkholderiales bacterium]